MAYHYVDPKTLSEPKSGIFEVKVNEWWLVDKGGNLTFYTRTGNTTLLWPQCNPDERIARLLAEPYIGYLEVKQIPIVYLPHSCSDYY